MDGLLVFYVPKSYSLDYSRSWYRSVNSLQGFVMPKSNNIQLYIGIDGLSSYINKADKDPSYEHYVRGDWDTETFQVIYPVALPEILFESRQSR